MDRLITEPGEACSYKIGEIKIKELRTRAVNALGSLFHMDKFHNVLLRCMGPLNIVESCVESYIQNTMLEIEYATDPPPLPASTADPTDAGGGGEESTSSSCRASGSLWGTVRTWLLLLLPLLWAAPHG